MTAVNPVTMGDKSSKWNVTLLCRKSGIKKITVADLIIITGVRESKPRILDIAKE